MENKILFIENINNNIHIKTINIDLYKENINNVDKVILDKYENYKELLNDIEEICNEVNPDNIYIDDVYFEYMTELLKEKFSNKINIVNKIEV